MTTWDSYHQDITTWGKNKQNIEYLIKWINIYHITQICADDVIKEGIYEYFSYKPIYRKMWIEFMYISLRLRPIENINICLLLHQTQRQLNEPIISIDFDKLCDRYMELYEEAIKEGYVPINYNKTHKPYQPLLNYDFNKTNLSSSLEPYRGNPLDQQPRKGLFNSLGELVYSYFRK